MLSLLTTLTTLGALTSGAPQIDEVTPTPVPLLATVEVRGSGFVDGATSLKLAEINQRLILVEAERLRFLVGLNTPLGEQMLTITTQGEGGGVAQVAVTVVPAVPQIQRVEPDILVLGRLGTVTGEGLATVASVTLGGLPCAVTEQTDALLVFEVPFAPELLGRVSLVLESPSGIASEDVSVTAPQPEIDALIPNPVRAGALVTLRGHIAGAGPALGPTVEVAAVEVPVVAIGPGPSDTTEVMAWLPTSLSPKPYDVVVISGNGRSQPAGPLIVEAASPKAPDVGGTYPARAALGATLWVAGAYLDTIESAVGGFELLGCDRRGCQLGTQGLPAGRTLGAVVGPEGAGVVELELVDEAAVVPLVTGTEPSPAIRGQTLVIRGERLAGVRSVVLGGVAQSIAFVDAGEVQVTVAAGTPLGAEPLFVAGNAASEAMLVTVLDPLPEVEAGPETVEEVETAEVVEAEDDAPSGGDDGGCSGGSAAWLWGLVGLLGLPLTSRKFG